MTGNFIDSIITQSKSETANGQKYTDEQRVSLVIGCWNLIEPEVQAAFLGDKSIAIKRGSDSREIGVAEFIESMKRL